MNNNIPVFKGPFKEVLPLFIQHKRALGYDYSGSTLVKYREMDNFFLSLGYTDLIMNQDMYELWIAKRGNEQATNRGRRHTVYYELATYLLSKGYSNITIPKRNTKMFIPNFVPYIFSAEEISNIFSITNLLVSQNKFKNINAFRTILSLLYCSGLRISEVLNLRYIDVNCKAKSIRIMDSKNHESRLIIVSSSVNNLLDEYINTQNFSDGEDFIFKNVHGNKMKYNSIFTIFHYVLDLANIPKRENFGGPRLHDLRHTFAVNSLERMVSMDYDIYTSLPLLSKYLGHKHITDTEYYLRFTKNHYDTVSSITNSVYKDIFPKVVIDDEM